MKKILATSFAILMILVSCKQEKNKSDIITIDLGKTRNKQGSKNFKLNDIAKNTKLIPIETNDSVLFRHVIIEGEIEEILVVHGGNLVGNKAIYFINKADGKVSSKIARHGQGPEEYILIGPINLNKRNNTLYLSDPGSKRVNEYTFAGKFIKSIRNDSVGGFVVFKDGNFAVSYSPFLETEFSLGIYDSSWNLLRKGIPKIGTDIKFDMVYFDEIIEFNDEYFYLQAHSDTLYRITADFNEPYLVLSKGKYKMPLEIKASLAETEKEGYKYITGHYGILASKYYFLSYHYNYKLYREIWDIEKSSLIYKHEFDYFRDGELGVSGVPIIIEGQKIYAWPSFASGQSLYCIIEGENTLKLMPELPMDTNPIILEIKLK